MIHRLEEIGIEERAGRHKDRPWRGKKNRFYEWNWATFGGGLRMKEVDWEGKGRSELVDDWGGWEGVV